MLYDEGIFLVNISGIMLTYKDSIVRYCNFYDISSEIGLGLIYYSSQDFISNQSILEYVRFCAVFFL